MIASIVLLVALHALPTDTAAGTTPVKSSTVTASIPPGSNANIEVIIRNPDKAREAIIERDHLLAAADLMLAASAQVPPPTVKEYVRWTGVACTLIGGGVLLGAKLSGNDVLPNRAARIGGVISGAGAIAAAVSFAF